jgi:hypothetical protein
MNERQPIEFEKRRYIAFRDRLLADDPEIDERTLADTLEGLTDFNEFLAVVIRGALDDEMMVEALKRRIGELTDRARRFETRADKRRALARDAMLEADLERLTQPDFTASVRRSTPSVVVIDENAIPQTFIEMRRHIRKRELLEALKDGAAIPGAALSNTGMTLSIRTR